MRRREFIMLVGGATAVWPLAARAQRADDRVRALLFRILSLEAEGVAATISQFLREIENQIGWTTQLPWSVGTMEQQQFDALRSRALRDLLRQAPAITEIYILDATGKLQLRLSRLATNVVSRNTDFSQDPKFTEAVAHKVYYGPVYLRQSEPYMTLSLAGTRPEAGVSCRGRSQAGLGLDPASEGRRTQRSLRARCPGPDPRPFRHVPTGPGCAGPSRRSCRSQPVSARSFWPRTGSGCARAGPSATTQARVARDINGREVLSASASVVGPGWHVFVELPVAEADTAVP